MHDMELALSTRTVDDFEIIEVGGEVDVYTAPKLREAIVTAIDAGHTRLIIDVEKVDFLDSTGLGVLIGVLRRINALGGELRLVCSTPRILDLFSLTDLDRVFDLRASVADATAPAGSETAAAGADSADGAA